MFGSSMIDIAIGMIFVFLLLSLIASTINEIILSFLNMRGKELLRGLKTLLDDKDATGLVEKLYNHGQIFGLFEGNFDPKKPGNLPPYIPAQNFVMALLDVVPAAATAGGQPGDGAGGAGGGGAGAGVQQDTAAMLASLRAAAQKLASDPKTEKVGKPLVSMIDTASNDASKLKKSVEDWYNSAMDRVSGWYKYRTQWILFGLGLVLAVFLNADAVGIMKQLSKDSALRQSIVAAAQSARQPDGQQGGQPITAQIDQVKSEFSSIENLGIPFGWTKEPPPPSAWGQWLQMILGWLLTAIGVSLGAPFWFDMLNKIMVMRSTVKPSETGQEKASNATAAAQTRAVGAS
jgi:hypothetical protein